MNRGPCGMDRLKKIAVTGIFLQKLHDLPGIWEKKPVTVQVGSYE